MHIVPLVCSFVYEPMCLTVFPCGPQTAMHPCYKKEQFNSIINFLHDGLKVFPLTINWKDNVCTSGLTLHNNVTMLGSSVVLLRPHTGHDVISSSHFSQLTACMAAGRAAGSFGVCLSICCCYTNVFQTTSALYTCAVTDIF